MFGISEVAILVIVAIVIFGAKKLPELARSAGKSARILKSEVKAMKADHGEAEKRSATYVANPSTETFDPKGMRYQDRA
jgi:sec-independent protein translocase protein TatA